MNSGKVTLLAAIVLLSPVLVLGQVGTFFDLTVQEDDVLQLMITDPEPLHELYIGGYVWNSGAFGWSIEDLPPGKRLYTLPASALTLPDPDGSAIQVVLPNAGAIQVIRGEETRVAPTGDWHVVKDITNVDLSVQPTGEFLQLTFSFDDENGLPEEYEISGFNFGYYLDYEYTIGNGAFANPDNLDANRETLKLLGDDKHDGSEYVAFGSHVAKTISWQPACDPGDTWDTYVQIQFGTSKGPHSIRKSVRTTCP